MQHPQLPQQAPAMTASHPKTPSDPAESDAVDHDHGASPAAPARPASAGADHDRYRTMVLRFGPGMTEENVDRQFVQMAHSLGIRIPPAPPDALDKVEHGVSDMSLAGAPTKTPTPPASPVSLRPPMSPVSPGRLMRPTAASSDSSSDQHSDIKGDATGAPSISSVVSSRTSIASSERSTPKGFKRGLRRFTTRRRKSLKVSVPDEIPMTKDSRPEAQPRNASEAVPRASTSSTQRTVSPRTPSAIMAERLSAHPPPPPLPMGDDPSLLDSPASRHRSMHCQRLKDLRGFQLQEQSRFLRFEKDQHRNLDSRYVALHEQTLTQHDTKEKDLEASHGKALVALEQRHLDAEADLIQALDTDRQACDTRLKHMQAYCSPKNNVEGMPERVVTKKDYNQLEAQYRLRNNMDNLHTSRINVLRERQAKQQERILAKQESEIEALVQDRRDALGDLEAKRGDESRHLTNDLAAKKGRLVARWSLSEAIERRKLENETGEAYGAWPPITWPDQSDVDVGGDADSGHGSGNRGSLDDRTPLAPDTMIAYI